jgi:hypothetical protein
MWRGIILQDQKMSIQHRVDDPMKTEVSIPNPIFEASKQLADRLDMSLSELYTVALAAYVATHQREEVTEKLNEVYETEESSLDPELVTLQVAAV